MKGRGSMARQALVAAQQCILSRGGSIRSRSSRMLGCPAGKTARGLLRGQSGQVLVMTAICMTLLMSIMALAVDVGHLQFLDQQLQTAADAAALAGGLETGSCGSTNPCTQMENAMQSAVTENNFNTPTVVTQCTTGSTSLVLQVNWGPCAIGSSDPNHGSTTYVEAVVIEKVPTFFGAIVGVPTATLVARSEAKATPSGGGGGGPCLYTNTLTLNSNSGVEDGTGSTCGIYDGGTATDDSGITVSVSSYNVQGSVTNNCSGCSTVSPQPSKGSVVANPLSSLTAPSAPSTTSTNVSTISGNTTLQPGTYTNTINFNSGTYTVTLQPGLYYFSGGFNIDSNVTITGTGVTLFFPSGSNVNINSAATWNLTAPSAALSNCASCAGMVVWSLGNSLDLDSASGSSFGGAVYMPNGTLTLNAASGATAYGIVDANAVMLDSTITLGCGSITGSTCPSGFSSGSTTTTSSLAE
jgi:Flp pilus assembly protein TadG